MITIGQQAPEFNLPDTEKNMHSLSSYRGKNVLILFYPAAFSGVCSKELCTTRDDISFYENMNAQVLGISVDMHFSNAKFKELDKINFPLLSDINKDAITAYECKYDTWSVGYKGVAKRSAFVIDKNGIVQYAEVLENAGDLPNFEAIKACLNTI